MELIGKAMENADEDENGVRDIRITFNLSSEVAAYNMQFPADFLTSETTGTNIKILTSIASLTVPDNMFKASDLANAQNVALNVSVVDNGLLPAEVAGIVGSRPVISISAFVDGKAVEWNNPDAPVTVSIPYTPTAEELADNEHITVWYIDGNGKPISVPSGRYDPDTGTVTFMTTHFSKYAVVYIKKAFHDMAGFAWAANQVNVLASKGIIEGISDISFTPERNITRGEFIMWVVKSLNLNAEVDVNFTDIHTSNECYEALGIARKLGIALGKGDNKYYSKEQLSRQDMMMLAVRALKAARINLTSGTIADLNIFADGANIAEYARIGAATMVRTGMIKGSGGYLNPTGNTSRAEAAMVIYRIHNYRPENH